MLRRIGGGCFTEDALAAQPSPTGIQRLVLVKRLQARLHDARPFVRAWLARASAALPLQHEGIVRLLAVEAQGAGGQIVCEYFSGETLRLLVSTLAARELTLPVGSACRIVAQAAEALAYAHALRDQADRPLELLHGDLAPENVLVTYAGQTKLLDFGLGRADPLRHHTPPGRLAGRLAHQAPEQLRDQPVDRRADLWGLGVLLHELLAGRLLFHGATPQELIQAVLEAPIPPPSHYNPAVPPALDRLVLAALERDPQRRLASAEALRSQLEPLLEQSEGAHPAAVGGWLRGSLRDCYLEHQRIERDARSEAIEALRTHGPPPWTAESRLLVGAPRRGAPQRGRQLRMLLRPGRVAAQLSALGLVLGASGLLAERLGRRLAAGEALPWLGWLLLTIGALGGALAIGWRWRSRRRRTSGRNAPDADLSEAAREAAAWRGEAQRGRKRLTETEHALSRADAHIADALEQLVEAEERASRVEGLERALAEAHAELRRLRDEAARATPAAPRDPSVQDRSAP